MLAGGHKALAGTRKIEGFNTGKEYEQCNGNEKT